MLPRQISSQGIWINVVVAQTIGEGQLDIGRRISKWEIRTQRESRRELPMGSRETQQELNRELPDEKWRDSSGIEKRTSR